MLRLKNLIVSSKKICKDDIDEQEILKPTVLHNPEKKQ